MNKPEAYSILERISEYLSITLGTQFVGFFVYGSVLEAHFHPERSDLNSCLIVTDDTDLNLVRSSFANLWETHSLILKRAPLVFTRTSFQRYLEFFPGFTSHLLHKGKQVGGEPLNLPHDPDPRPETVMAYDANQLIVASSLLAADLLDQGRRRQAERALDRLLRKYNVVDNSLNLAEKISYLAQRFEKPIETPLPEDAPPYGVDGLLAIYESLGNDYFVVKTAADIAGIDCAEAVEEFSNREITSLNIGTVSQFKLVVEELYPLDVTLFSYQRIWGVDLLKDVHPTPEAVLSHAARFAISLEVDIFPHALLSRPSDPVTDGKLIHDFQNKLLNIRLQNDLLYRLKISKQGEPPVLPGRNESHSARLEAIWEQFRWWTAFYEDILKSTIPTMV